MTTPYLSLEKFKETGNVPGYADDAALTRALHAATRAIERTCERTFHEAGEAAVRTVRAEDGIELALRDFTAVTAVATDTTGDGTFNEAWDVADYLAEPVDPDDGWPYVRLAAVGSKRWPTSGRRPRVQVTAQWGWPAVPDEIVMATQLLTQRLSSRRGTADLGIVDFGESAGYIARRDPDVQNLIGPYMKHPVLIA